MINYRNIIDYRILFVGLLFYISVTFIYELNIHFVHVWGIEFILNMVTMFVFSYIFPHKKKEERKRENERGKEEKRKSKERARKRGKEKNRG